MRAGLLKETIGVLIPASVVDAYRSKTTVYKEEYTTRARVQTPGSSRSVDNMEIFFGASAIITIRIYHTILPTYRLRWQGRDYRIVGIDPDREKQEQRIRVELINE